MAVEFGPVIPNLHPHTKYLSRSATPEGFAVALRTIDIPTPQSMTVLFGPETPRPEATARRTIDWVTHRNAFTIGHNDEAEIVDEQRLKHLVDSEDTSTIIINLNGVSKKSNIVEGMEIFTNQFLPTLTRVAFLPVSGLIVGPVGPTGSTLSYENPEMRLYPYETKPATRDSLIYWFEQLPNQR
jgi:hypothetical protein